LKDVYKEWFKSDGSLQPTVVDYQAAGLVYNATVMKTEVQVKNVLDGIKLYDPEGPRIYWYTTEDTKQLTSDPQYTKVDIMDSTLKRTKHNNYLMGAEAGFLFNMPSFTTTAMSDVRYGVTYEMAWQVVYTLDDGARRSYVETISSDGRRSTTTSNSGMGSSEHIKQTHAQTLVKTTPTGSSSGFYSCPDDKQLEFKADEGARCILWQLTNDDSDLQKDLQRIEGDVRKIEDDTSDNGLILLLVILCSVVLMLVIIGIVCMLMYQRSLHTMTWKLGTMLAKPTRSDNMASLADSDSVVKSRSSAPDRNSNRRGGLI